MIRPGQQAFFLPHWRRLNSNDLRRTWRLALTIGNASWRMVSVACMLPSKASQNHRRDRRMTIALYHIFRRPAALKSPDERQDDTPTRRVEGHAIETPDPSVTRQRCRSMRLLRLDVVQRRPLALIE